MLCIIPARGGSKRIPRKNIRPFLGKPIIAYSIEAAKKSGLFTEIMVSTDDAEIAEVAKQYGAQVPFFRSGNTADDYATLNDVFMEVKNQYLSINQSFDYSCMILATSPLIQSELLSEALELLKKSDFDSVRPVVRFDYPIQRALKLSESGAVGFINEAHAKTRSQDLEPAFHDAGMFYFVKGNAQMSVGNKGAFEMDSRLIQDIDTEEDWKMAEMKYQLLMN